MIPDFFDNFNQFLKKDLVPILTKNFKNPDNKITDNLNDFFKDPQIFINEIIEKLLINKDIDNNQSNYTDIENNDDIDQPMDNDYEELFQRLIIIEENMINLEKILKDAN